MVVPKFDENSLRALCNILGDTYNGLTGSEIGDLLSQTDINDPEPTGLKGIAY
jgi:hypothetical protein